MTTSVKNLGSIKKKRRAFLQLEAHVFMYAKSMFGQKKFKVDTPTTSTPFQKKRGSGEANDLYLDVKDNEIIEKLDCPVCNVPVASSKINEHVEEHFREPKQEKNVPDMPQWCLKKQTDQHSKGESQHFSHTPTRQTQRSLSWGVHGGVIKSKLQAQATTHSSEKTSSENHTRTPASSRQMSRTNENSTRPLAERMRPTDLDNFIGQTNVIGPASALRSLLDMDRIPSLILWGGPGCGKTSLAKIISRRTTSHFVELSAVSSGVTDLRRVITEAKGRRKLLKTSTILFIDEIHRFNKSQQDTLLPHVERGDIVLIGATTENPSFSCNSALLSRCRVVAFEKLSVSELVSILTRALNSAQPPPWLPDPHTETQKSFPTSSQLSSQNKPENPSTYTHTHERALLPKEIEAVSAHARRNAHSQDQLLHSEEKKVLEYIANIADGDARTALNMLEISLMSHSKRQGDIVKSEVDSSIKSGDTGDSVYTDEQERAHTNAIVEQTARAPVHIDRDTGTNINSYVSTNAYISTSSSSWEEIGGIPAQYLPRITMKAMESVIQKSHLLYDRNGEEHYNIISALHKSMRGSDANASIYWLARMLGGGEDPRYIARRLVRFASEDVGMADPAALVQAVAAHDACEKIGMPECSVCLAQCVVYMANAPKSVSVYKAYKLAAESVKNSPAYPVPLHIRNAPTKLMKDMGYGKGYLYNPDHTMEECSGQTYLPDELLGSQFYVEK
eukprot:CFRG5633T1